MLTLADALKVASEGYWKGRPGASSMGTFASRCVNALGPEVDALGLNPRSDPVKLLAFLRGQGLSEYTVKCYYSAFRSMLKLNGVSTEGWPNCPPVPRVKSREAMTVGDVDRLILWLDGAGFPETADLARLIKGTGLRSYREAMTEGAIKVVSDRMDYTVLEVTGKGGHQRHLAVSDKGARAVILSPKRLCGVQKGIPYWTHLRRWKAGVEALGISSKLPTPHSVRHTYATQVHKASGHNLKLVGDVLGHASVKTTERYLTTDLDAVSRAASNWES